MGALFIISSSNNVIAVTCCIIIKKQKETEKKTRCAWVKNWHRTEAGAFHQLMAELKVSDPYSYRKYVCMDVETFEVAFKYINYQ